MATTALQILLPSRTNPKGTAVTGTFNPSATQNVLSAPAYNEHLSDIFDSRAAGDSRSLLQDMFRTDPDISAAVNAFLTVADTELVVLVYDEKDVLDPKGQEVLHQQMNFLATRSDYTKGFRVVNSWKALGEAARYMVLLRGVIAGELVINPEFYAERVQWVDGGRLSWYEKTPGFYTPEQEQADGKKISLDLPNFFCTWFRKDPSQIYSYSPFISAINTIAARQQIINDLYRIMKVTGYPRLEVTIVEEVLMKNAPMQVKAGDQNTRNQYLQAQIGFIRSAINTMRPDSAFVHTDSFTTGMLNEKAPGVSMKIEEVIAVLNSQNQAALKTMATIIGRGESGVNTASVEARIFSLSAQAINVPVADWFSQALTLVLRLSGSTSRVECYYAPVEMRSDTELETQMLVRSQRLKEDLSLGIITDEEYHLQMYNRLPPPGYKPLMGTGFMQPQTAGVDATALSPNGDPVGKAASAPRGNKGARDNKTKTSRNSELIQALMALEALAHG